MNRSIGHSTLQCDGCGVLFDSDEKSYWNTVRQQAQAAGWATDDPADKDWCPTCVNGAGSPRPPLHLRSRGEHHEPGRGQGRAGAAPVTPYPYDFDAPHHITDWGAIKNIYSWTCACGAKWAGPEIGDPEGAWKQHVQDGTAPESDRPMNALFENCTISQSHSTYVKPIVVDGVEIGVKLTRGDDVEYLMDPTLNVRLGP